MALSQSGPSTVVSLVLHVGLLAGLAWLPRPGDPRYRIDDVRVELRAEPPPPAPTPEPEPEVLEPEVLEPEPPMIEPSEPERRERVREPETTPDPTPAIDTPPEEPPPLEERIEDFTGETLSNADTTAPTVIAGNGEAVTGPVGAATGTATGRSRRGVADGAPAGHGSDPEADGVPVVAAANLSRATRYPDGFSDIVSRHYPRELRARGIEGSARVRFRVLPGGRIILLRMVSETEEGFGQACMEALRESSGEWVTPLDRSGNEVAQNVPFTCHFSLRF